MNNRIGTIVAATGLAGSLLVGGIGIASAQSSPTTPSAKAANPAPRFDHSQRLAEALAPLVTSRTITQAQADAIVKALEAHLGGRRDGGHVVEDGPDGRGDGGHGGMAGRGGHRAPGRHGRGGQARPAAAPAA